MASRLKLHEILCEKLGTRNVYFQPPASVNLKFPCIIYEKSNVNSIIADDTNYISKKQYTVTVIDKNPDSEIPDRIEELPYCSFERHFVNDNLNHDVYKIYY